MAVKTNAIIEGVVMRVSTRRGETTDGKKWERHNVLVVGDYTLADVTIRGDQFALPTQGEVVRGVVEIDVYRDEDSCTLVEWL